MKLLTADNLTDTDDSVFYVICNGPSLRGFDFTTLKDKNTIGMNVAYRMFEEIDFWPTYWCCADTRVGLFHVDEFERLASIKDSVFFLRDNASGKLKQHDNVYTILWDTPLTNSPSLTIDRARRTIHTYIPNCTGSIGAAIGIALGCKTVVLLGADCNYVERLPGAKDHGLGKLTLTKDLESNPNYWFDDYQKAGDKYHVPNGMTVHIKGWKSLHELAKDRDVDVVNCSLQSRIPFFRKVEFNQLTYYNESVYTY